MGLDKYRYRFKDERLFVDEFRIEKNGTHSVSLSLFPNIDLNVVLIIFFVYQHFKMTNR